MKIKDFKLKYSNRAIIIFEQIMNKAFTISNITEQYVFFYSVLLANNMNEFKLTFDEFLDWLDEDKEVLEHLTNWLIKELKIKQQIQQPQDEKKNLEKK